MPPSSVQSAVEVRGVATDNESPIMMASPVVWVDPVNGSDTNAGTQNSPWRTIGTAYAVLGMARWAGPAHINVMPGVESGGANPKWHVPNTYGNGSTEPVVIVDQVPTDSGLGVVVATGGTAGATTTFGTVTTGLAMALNAFRGWQVTWSAATTTAALRGKNYPIAKNSAGGLLTIAGTMAAAPVGTDTFTITKPGWTFSYTGKLTIVSAQAYLGIFGAILDANNGTLSVEGTHVAIQNVHHLHLATGNGIALASGSTYTFFDGAIHQNLGIQTFYSGFFAGNSAGGGLILSSFGANAVLVRSVHQDAPVLAVGPSRVGLNGGCYLTGNSYAIAKLSGGTLSVLNSWFDACNSAPQDNGDAFGAIGCKDGYVLVNGALVENTTGGAGTTGDALTIVGNGEVDIQALTGLGNAGVGARFTRKGSGHEARGTNTAAGAGGQVVLGGNAAVNWAALATPMNSDLAAAVPQGCFLHST